MPVIDTCPLCVCVLNLVIYHKSHNDLAKFLRRNGQNETLKLSTPLWAHKINMDTVWGRPLPDIAHPTKKAY